MTNRRGSSRLGPVDCARAAGEPNVTIAAAALVSFRNSRRGTGGVGMRRGFAAAIRNKTGKESTLPLRQVLHDGGLNARNRTDCALAATPPPFALSMDTGRRAFIQQFG